MDWWYLLNAKDRKTTITITLDGFLIMLYEKHASYQCDIIPIQENPRDGILPSRVCIHDVGGVVKSIGQESIASSSSSLYTCLYLYPDKDTLTWFHPVSLAW